MEKFYVIERYYDNGKCTIEKAKGTVNFDKMKSFSNHDQYVSTFKTEQEQNDYYLECLESGEF
jgi:hypothetical protein